MSNLESRVEHLKHDALDRKIRRLGIIAGVLPPALAGLLTFLLVKYAGG